VSLNDISYCFYFFRVYISIIFGAISVGRESQFGPDYGKGKAAAARIFQLLDRTPCAMDSYSTEGAQPVSRPHAEIYCKTLIWLQVNFTAFTQVKTLCHISIFLFYCKFLHFG
jgi:hypothetical protein